MNITAIKIIVTLLIAAAAGVAVWLLLRSIRLWYWRTDEITGSIREMGNKIDNLETGLDNVKISTEKLVSETREVNARLESFDAKLRQLKETGYRQIEGSTEGLDDILREKPVLPEGDIPDEREAVSDSENAPEVGESISGEEKEVKRQVENLEQELENLKKEKERLKAEINARIRD